MPPLNTIDAEGIAYAKANALRDLLRHKGWIEIIAPELERRAAHHLQQAIDRNLSPAQRAEHIEAAHGFAEMVKWPDTQIKNLRVQCK